MVGDTRVASELASLPSYTNPSAAGSATVFYYHPDHLQSTAFTTGSDGSLLQHDEYIATGEVWFQEAKNNDSRNTQPWLFNAKELDETGLYAFGARYYNPKYSIWSTRIRLCRHSSEAGERRWRDVSAQPGSVYVLAEQPCQPS